MTIDFCKIEYNAYDQPQCHGCKQIGKLFARLRKLQDSDKTAQSSYTSHDIGRVKIHNRYQELCRCAQRCIVCQTFQRGLLLQQITVGDTRAIRDNPVPVFASLSWKRDTVALHISIGLDESIFRNCTTVLCSDTNVLENAKGITDGADWKRLRQWINQCDNEHSCRKYRWSNRNPSWLIKILPDNLVQLVKGSQVGDEMKELVRYVALSYCWGDESSITKEDPEGWDRVQRAHTRVLAKGQPVAERLHPFTRDAYPETLQDAIKVVEDLGVEYIWIDNVCIPELDNWETEATKMHEVYGNAYFTLFACAANKAIDRLRIHREAWDHPLKGSKLYGHWLSNLDPTLNEIRMQNPLAQRGWILQEERLSPRILYWCAQRAYWSCCEKQAIELRQSNQETSSYSTQSRPPQHFIMLSRSGETDELHREWLNTVESYSRRSLAEQAKEKDRFRAISGLAARYLSTGNHMTPQGNEYLAGLWRTTFARDLSWRVVHGVDPSKSLKKVAPTWSWASLPLCTEIDLLHDFETSSYFHLLQASQVQADDTAQDIVTRGENVKGVQVESRFRPLIHSDSVLVPWESVWRKLGHQNVFDMSIDPAQAVHARGPDGQVLIYEAHKEEIIAQLDYTDSGLESIGSLAIGMENTLHCLELGRSTMLLLEQIDEASDAFQRVGVAIGYRKNFFDGYGPRKTMLL